MTNMSSCELTVTAIGLSSISARDGDDLVIEEIDNCVLRAIADPFPLPVSSIEDTQHVEVILTGSRLRVLVDNVLVVDRVLDLPQRAGR